MPDRLSIHAPVLVNTLGHFAGLVVFAILLYYLLLDWRRDRTGSFLPSLAAALALLWNLGSLIGMATVAGDPVSDAIVAASFSVLSVLPAILLRIALGSQRQVFALSGYAISAVAVALHVADMITDAATFHYAAILLVTIGFGTLTAVELIREVAHPNKEGRGKQLAFAMVLFLLAISFAHFRADHDTWGWSGEAALHHAAIPLALFVLLQDYRFVLADAFVRFLSSAALAALTIWIIWALHLRFPVLTSGTGTPFQMGLLFIGSCGLISLFSYCQTRLQKALTRVVFLRHSADAIIASLRERVWSASSEAAMRDEAIAVIGTTFSAARTAVVDEQVCDDALNHAVPVIDAGSYGCPAWVRVIAPLRFSRGDSCCFLLGARSGGRRYLSEDLALLDRMTTVVCERIEQARHMEMQSLVSQAELRALQAQINPHFFFNALNTLYGVIPRESASARRLVLNMAELFRMSFASERTLIRIEEEVRIVRAYLEIEQLRLGRKLRSEIVVADEALQVEVPVLSIQPLVENAIKHGVASRAEGGFVRLSVEVTGEFVLVTVTNSGRFEPVSGQTRGTGVGMANVHQ
ncbi:MAG: hypothetical protein JWN34_1048 [Bryobacterales bacterium]|nr:hypothetical protein [Bryobacterales bacterium]